MILHCMASIQSQSTTPCGGSVAKRYFTTRKPKWVTNGSKSLSRCSESYPLTMHRVAITLSDQEAVLMAFRSPSQSSLPLSRRILPCRFSRSKVRSPGSTASRLVFRPVARSVSRIRLSNHWRIISEGLTLVPRPGPRSLPASRDHRST